MPESPFYEIVNLLRNKDFIDARIYYLVVAERGILLWLTEVENEFIIVSVKHAKKVVYPEFFRSNVWLTYIDKPFKNDTYSHYYFLEL